MAQCPSTYTFGASPCTGRADCRYCSGHLHLPRSASAPSLLAPPGPHTFLTRTRSRPDLPVIGAEPLPLSSSSSARPASAAGRPASPALRDNPMMSPIIRAGPTRTKRGLRFIEALEEEPVFGSAAAGEGPQAVEGVTAEGRAKSARVRAGAREKAKRYHQSDERVIFEAEGLGRKTSGMLGDKRRIWQEYQRGMFRNFMNSIRRERGG